MCLATDFVDALIEFHGADKGVDGLEEEFRWSVRLGDDAADLEPEEGYLLLQAVEFEGVSDGLAVFLLGVGRVEAVGEGVPVAQLATSAAFWGLMVGFVRCHGDRVWGGGGCWEGGDVTPISIFPHQGGRGFACAGTTMCFASGRLWILHFAALRSE